jgi:hypothetical protein
MRVGEDRSSGLIALSISGLSSFLLLAGAIYAIKEFSIFYGIGLGAGLQSSASNSPIVPILQSYLTNISSFHQGILESYLLFMIAFMLIGASFINFIRAYDRDVLSGTYVVLHTAFTVVYILLLFVILSDFAVYLQSAYLYLVYAGAAGAFLSDTYLVYLSRKPSAKQPHMKHAFSINPSTPFSNVINLQDQLFSQMHGHLRIVDKHFNSIALANLHRLIENSMPNFTKISILTSKEMLDSKFNESVSDFRAELSGPGIGLEIRVMDGTDAMQQHERILMDDKIAYKIPPFNIITKRSEHITKINYSEADRRFSQLLDRSIKMENYAVKKGRDNTATEPHAESPQP